MDMSQGESLIVILLAVIAYLLYQIARQLTFLTGRKMKFPRFRLPARKKYHETRKEEPLPN